MPFHNFPDEHNSVSIVDVGHDHFAVVYYHNGVFCGATRKSGTKEWAEAVATTLGSHDTLGDPCDLFVRGTYRNCYFTER